MKCCSKCGTEKSLDSFWKDKTKKDGLLSVCKDCRKEFWFANKERINKQQREYYWEPNVRKQRITDRQTKRQNQPELFLWYGAKQRATKRKLDFNLTINDIIIPEKCPILDIKLERNLGGNSSSLSSPTVDRIDNTKGYTKNNIVVISWKANRLKNNATIEDLEKIVNFYKSLNQ